MLCFEKIESSHEYKKLNSAGIETPPDNKQLSDGECIVDHHLSQNVVYPPIRMDDLKPDKPLKP